MMLKLKKDLIIRKNGRVQKLYRYKSDYFYTQSFDHWADNIFCGSLLEKEFDRFKEESDNREYAAWCFEVNSR